MDEQSDKDTAQTQDQSVDLESLKQQALQVLVPLVDEMQGAPAQRFEVLIMAARSSGDGVLLNKALEAAQQLENSNEKANAVLDVLNEINYQLQTPQNG